MKLSGMILRDRNQKPLERNRGEGVWWAGAPPSVQINELGRERGEVKRGMLRERL